LAAISSSSAGNKLHKNPHLLHFFFFLLLRLQLKITQDEGDLCKKCIFAWLTPLLLLLLCESYSAEGRKPASHTTKVCDAWRSAFKNPFLLNFSTYLSTLSLYWAKTEEGDDGEDDQKVFFA